MCDCIEQLETKAREKYGDPDGYLDATIGISGPPKPITRYITRTKHKNGNLSRGQKEIPILPNYCPFCGKSYNTQEPDNANE